MKWAGIVAGITLAISCFLPWVVIESRNITVTGIDASGTRFGRPGYFHIAMSVLFLLFTFIRRVWAKRTNLWVVAMNFAWALRNYFTIPACEGGECPQKEIGIYLLVFSSILMLAAALFPDMKLPEPVRENKHEGQSPTPDPGVY